MNEKYKYHLRPAYGSDELLIEFLDVADEDIFISLLFETWKNIHPKISSSEDVWMNDEVWLTVASSEGEFLLTIDIWRFVFIMAEKNQDCVRSIAEILGKSAWFEKIEIDFNNYKNQSLNPT